MYGKLSFLAGLVLLCLSVLTAVPFSAAPPPVQQAGTAADSLRSLGEIRAAAQAFIATLGPAGRAKALFPFASEARFDWHFVPREREGLPLKEMTLEQRRAAHDLIRSALSSRGYLKATHIMVLESILYELENQSPRRDPERYYLSIFGTPSAGAPWGFRIEGHHLSLNYTSATNELSTTPAFFGANPAEVRTGPYAGLRVLAAEEDLGRALMTSLSPQQRAVALIATEAPRDIIMMPEREDFLEKFEGLPAAEMTPAQREVLMQILHEYTHNMPHDVAHLQMEKIERAGPGNLYFAWAGDLERGGPHYYRVHGPTFVFEYDNTQNDANHVHTVWRDLEGDFGEDLLRRHYEHAGPGHGH